VDHTPPHPKLADRPVFICGHPKSGTSLLRNLLDGHPQLVVYPEESLFFRRFLPAARDKELAEKLNLADELLIHIFTWNQGSSPPSQEGFPDRDYSAFPFEQVRQAFRQRVGGQTRHEGELLSAAVLAFGEVSGQIEGARWWVEKTPYNETYAEQIFAWWPEARCIHIVRDPRDNYASYRQKHPDWNAKVFARNWANSTQQGSRNQDRFGQDRYWILTYETFVQSPEETIRKLCQFLEIQERPALRQPTRAGQSWAGNSMFQDQFSGISAAAVNRWQENLDPTDVLIIEAITGHLMARLGFRQSGYKLDTLPIPEKARVLRERLGAAVRRSKITD